MCVGVKQEFGFVKAHAVFRYPRTVNAISIPLPRSNSGKVAVPDRTVAVRHGVAGFYKLSIDLVKQAQLYGISGVAPDRKVCSAISDRCAKGSRICRKHGGYLALCQVLYKVTRLFLRKLLATLVQIE